MHKNTKNKKSEIFFCKMFAGIYPLTCGVNLEDQVLSALNIDIP